MKREQNKREKETHTHTINCLSIILILFVISYFFIIPRMISRINEWTKSGNV